MICDSGIGQGKNNYQNVSDRELFPEDTFSAGRETWKSPA